MNGQFIFITAGRWQSPAIIKAKKMGFEVIGVDTNKSAEGLRHCDFRISGFDLDTQSNIILDAIKDQKKTIVGCISFCSDAGQRLAAKIRNHFSLQGDTQETTINFLDKSIQRAKWKSLDAKEFQWEEFNDPKLALTSLGSLRRWKVVKPVDSSGSRGVSILRRNQDNENAIYEAFRNSRSKRILIEDFIPGIEYTVDSIILDGQVHTLLITKKKKVSKELLTVSSELQVVKPQAKLWRDIHEKAASAIKALGKLDGATHLEVIVNQDKEIHLVEASSRGGGFGLASDFIPLATGVDYTGLSLRIASGSQVKASEVKPRMTKHGILKFITSHQGFVTNVSGFEEANMMTDVMCESFVEVGDEVNATHSDGDRLGSIMVVGQTPPIVNSLMRKVEMKIRVEVE